jgi:succinoglycan biosynthesis protein ExoO
VVGWVLVGDDSVRDVSDRQCNEACAAGGDGTPMSTPEISVIMANYNGAVYLPAALQSLLRQTLKSWELIFVDDASSDESVALVRQFARRDSRIRFFRQSVRHGPAAARNRALDAANGTWVAVFDSDDLMMPERLERLLRRATDDQATIIADNLMLFSEADSKPRRYLRNRLGRSPHWIGLAEFVDSNCLYSPTPDLGYLKPMIRTDIVRRLNAHYDESLRIGEDYDFLGRIMAEGHQIRLDPAAMYLYRKHTSSVSHRLTAGDITALLAADQRFRRRADLMYEEIRALDRRRGSLESLRIYDEVIASLKGGNPARGAVTALSQPRIWPLLTRPLAARVKRLAQALANSAVARAHS